MFGRHKKLLTPPAATDSVSIETELGTSPSLAAAMPKKRWTRVHQLLHDNHGVRYFVMALVVIIGTGVALWGYISLTREPEPTPQTITVKPKPKPAPKYYSPLTGLETEEVLTTRHITAIMIENSPEARPQSGLKAAGIVYEAVAEGGITRFLALYQESRPSLIGPVRSVRPYYVQWASAYDPAIVHVGGSQQALTMVRSGSYAVDIDEFFNPRTLWRVKDRAAPHNVYTSFDALDPLVAQKGKAASTFTGFSRIDGKKAETPTASTVDIAVSTGKFAVRYTYDPTTNTYVRLQGGVNHVDRESGQITPSVVIAIKVNESTAYEGDGYREQITTTGTGAAYVFQNGTVVEGTWSRDGEKSPLRLLDASNKEIVLNRGQTWITALANTKGVTWQ